jgi:hypothetical protein
LRLYPLSAFCQVPRVPCDEARPNRGVIELDAL